MKHYCNYHPSRPAHWHCEKCRTFLCPACVDTRDMGGHHQGEKLHMCPKCNLPLQWLGVGNIIDPFWKRLPRFFLYPFSKRPLVLMSVLAIVAAVAPAGGIIGVLASVAVWGIVFKYAYAILQSTASGDLTAPGLGGPTLVDNFGPVIKQLGIYVVIFFAAGFVQSQLGIAAMGLFLILATLFLPAMIILLVTTESLIQALNPMMFIRLALRIGWGYLLMYFFCSILGGAPALLAAYFIKYLPTETHVLLFSFVKIYYTFISYNLMGYVILQYHQQIGYQVDVDDFKDDSANDEARQEEGLQETVLRHANQRIQDGEHQKAILEIEQAMAGQQITHPQLSHRYFMLLALTGASEKLAADGPALLELLLRGNCRSEAIEAYLKGMAVNPGFTPSAAALFKLGSWLNDAGKSNQAIGAFNNLTKAHPRDPLVPKAYFRAAQILNDRLQKPEKARRILRGLRKHYASHDIIPFVERYLEQMG
jgi:TolA-binding protein